MESLGSGPFSLMRASALFVERLSTEPDSFYWKARCHGPHSGPYLLDMPP